MQKLGIMEDLLHFYFAHEIPTHSVFQV